MSLKYTYFLQAHSSEIKLYGRWPCLLAEVVSSKVPDEEINLTNTKVEAPMTVADFTVRISRKFNSLNEIQKDPEDVPC